MIKPIKTGSLDSLNDTKRLFNVPIAVRNKKQGVKKMIQSRTHNCNELRLSDAGKNVTIVGWYENIRKVSKNLDSS